jgi:hypothetical protein
MEGMFEQHQLKELIRQAELKKRQENKKYYEKTKEKRKLAYKKQNSEKVTCECGSKIAKVSMDAHLVTSKHVNFMKSCRTCAYCNKTLVTIGRDRKNGVGDYKDWEGRKYHKKCYEFLENMKKIRMHAQLPEYPDSEDMEMTDEDIDEIHEMSHN